MTAIIPRKIILVAKDRNVVECLGAENSEQYTISGSNSVLTLLQQAELLADCSIVIIDIDDDGETSDNDIVDNLQRLKSLQPGILLIVLGERDRLTSLLNTQLQTLSYRIFAKPVSAKQVFLSFHGTENHRPIASEPIPITPAMSWGKPVLGFAIAGSLIAFIAWGAMNGVDAGQKERLSMASSAAQAAQGTAATATISATTTISTATASTIAAAATPSTAAPTTTTTALAAQQSAQPVLADDGRQQQTLIDEFNYLAVAAQRRQQLTSPARDNALYYYNKVLALDPFDTTAFLGRKNIVERLRKGYVEEALAGRFDRAFELIQQLQRLAPKIVQQYALRQGLQNAIQLQVVKLRQQGNELQLAALSAMLENLLPAFPEVQALVSSLQLEQVFKAKIDNAMLAQRLLPQQQGSAFTLLIAARTSASITPVSLQRRVTVLADALVQRAQEQALQGNFLASLALLAPLRELIGDGRQLTQLNDYINAQRQHFMKQQQQQQAAREREQQRAAEELARAARSAISPPSIISRALPRYPEKARRNEIEGWVQLRFSLDSAGQPVNIEVVDAQPRGVFDSAARNAVSLWRFTPAVDGATGLPVAVEIMDSTLRFTLSDSA